MAGPQRRPHADLIERLRTEPFRFEFFQAVRVLSKIAPARAPVGLDGPYDGEVVRFAQHIALNFPASSIDWVDGLPGPAAAAEPGTPEAGPPPTLTTAFMGLVGPMGVLPTVYTEELVGPLAKRRGPAVEFLNLFHHRLVSLFYRAWEKYDLPSRWEQARAPAVEPNDDAFAESLFHLVGLGPEPLRGRMTVEDDAFPYYAGLFAQQHRSAVMLERLLVDYFDRPARVVSFVGRWLKLRPEEQTRLGTRGAFNRLGADAVAGRKVWDVQGKYRIRIGPLSLADFHEFLPGGAAASRVMDLARFYDRGELDFDVQLVLRKEEVPSCRIGRDAGAARLGRSAWLKRREFDRDADDAVFRPG